MFACNGILFNHESPRRGANFVTMKIINGIKEIVLGKKESIALGNIDSKRDWGHAKDYILGMWLMLQHNKPDDYVLATNKTTSVRVFVEKCFEFAGKKIIWVGEKGTIHEEGCELVIDDKGNQQFITRIVIDSKFYRPCEVNILLGNANKANTILGWEPTFDLDLLIKDMFEGS